MADEGKLTLYSWWLSSCAYRIRIVLNLKGLDYEHMAVDLLKGEQSDPDFERINPMKFVPALVDGDTVIVDSFAIALYLEEKYPQSPLLPRDLKKKALSFPVQLEKIICFQELLIYLLHLVIAENSAERAKIMQFIYSTKIASIVASGIQPLQNLVVVNYIEQKLGSQEKNAWLTDQVNRVFTALEKLLNGCAGKYAAGDEIGLGDVFLAPQLYYVIKILQIDVSNYPILARLHAAYEEIPAFQAAVPENQPDAPSI